MLLIDCSLFSVTRREKFYVEVYGIRECRVVIERDHRFEFIAGSTVPPRVRNRRQSVATDRYVGREVVEPAGVDMEIDADLTERNANDLQTENYSASQLQNLAAFNNIPNVVARPEGFFAFHHQRRNDLPRPVPALMPAGSNVDNYFQNLPRMFEPFGGNRNHSPAFSTFDQQYLVNGSLPQAAGLLSNLNATFTPAQRFESQNQQTYHGFIDPNFRGLSELSRYCIGPQYSVDDSMRQLSGRFPRVSSTFESAQTASFPVQHGEQSVAAGLRRLPESITFGHRPFAYDCMPQAAAIVPRDESALQHGDREEISAFTPVLQRNSQQPRRPVLNLHSPESQSNDSIGENRENVVPNLMTDAYSFLDYCRRAASKFN